MDNNFKILDDSRNYTAQVIKLPVKQTIPGLDNLVVVDIYGNSCLIPKNYPEDQLYIFFPAGSQLAADYLSNNNLYRDEALNKDTSKKSYFDEKGRVKAIKLKGIISTGVVMPLHSLPLDYTLLNAGDEFNEFNGWVLCKKYIVPALTQANGVKKERGDINTKLVDLMVKNQFRFHSDTAHLARNLHNINPNDIIVITDKWHGSSCILSRVLTYKKLTFWQKILNKLGGQISDKEYTGIYSSGKPKSNLVKGIDSKYLNDGKDYYISNIWKRAYDDYKDALEDGISLYGELVGFTEGGSAIQAGYDYSCYPGKYRLLIYRITYTKLTGETIEFSWQQIKDYCEKHALDPVKEIFYGRAIEIVNNVILDGCTMEDSIEGWRNRVFKVLEEKVESLGNCSCCRNKVPAEGFVVRIDGKQSFSAYKLKAKKFLLAETKELENDIVNIEDQQ